MSEGDSGWTDSQSDTQCSDTEADTGPLYDCRVRLAEEEAERARKKLALEAEERSQFPFDNSCGFSFRKIDLVSCDGEPSPEADRCMTAFYPIGVNESDTLSDSDVQVTLETYPWPDRRGPSLTTVVGGDVYVLGYSRESCTSYAPRRDIYSLHIFHSDTREWEEVTPPAETDKEYWPRVLDYGKAFQCEGQLVVTGTRVIPGIGEGTATASFNPDSRQWKDMTPSNMRVPLIHRVNLETITPWDDTGDHLRAVGVTALWKDTLDLMFSPEVGWRLSHRLYTGNVAATICASNTPVGEAPYSLAARVGVYGTIDVRIFGGIIYVLDCVSGRYITM
ncbi:hypothetical protein KIPB_004591 [Kipferlia bialata]|uniref:Uncharacterized protein n=1 Tax=Kipferlia bialata TaxID=797122 RepID=A0A391NVX2_9EUKA|nr:hypothetical protein KIPB_004591 [Kipferlia bialata]|eukprot:g4591.t1